MGPRQFTGQVPPNRAPGHLLRGDATLSPEGQLGAGRG